MLTNRVPLVAVREQRSVRAASSRRLYAVQIFHLFRGFNRTIFFNILTFSVQYAI